LEDVGLINCLRARIKKGSSQEECSKSGQRVENEWTKYIEQMRRLREDMGQLKRFKQKAEKNA